MISFDYLQLRVGVYFVPSSLGLRRIVAAYLFRCGTAGLIHTLTKT